MHRPEILLITLEPCANQINALETARHALSNIQNKFIDIIVLTSMSGKKMHNFLPFWLLSNFSRFRKKKALQDL